MFLDAHWGLVTLVVGIGTRHRVYEYPMWPFMGIGVHGNPGYGVYLRFVNPMVGYLDARVPTVMVPLQWCPPTS